LNEDSSGQPPPPLPEPGPGLERPAVQVPPAGPDPAAGRGPDAAGSPVPAVAAGARPGAGAAVGVLPRPDFRRLLHLLTIEKLIRLFRLVYLGFLFAATLRLDHLGWAMPAWAFGGLLGAYFLGTLVFAQPRWRNPRASLWLAAADLGAITAIFALTGGRDGYAGGLYYLAFALAAARLPLYQAAAIALAGMGLHSAAGWWLGAGGPAAWSLLRDWLAASGTVGFVAYLAWAEGQQRRARHQVERLLEDLRGTHRRLREYALLVDHLAYRDGLTDLYNYRFFREALREELERESSYDRPVSLVMLDLDHFKRYNDTYGHDEGNRLLKALSDLLRAATREWDILCRFGGEEFAVILPGANLEVALKVAERIRQAVEQHRFADGEWRQVTVSAGVASFPEHAGDPDGLVQRADQALYVAKQSGRNQVASAVGGQPN